MPACPPTVAWALSPGVRAGAINWPVPQKTILATGASSLCTYIYEDRVVLLVPIRLDARVGTGSLTLRAALTWLECEDNGLCVAGKSVVSGTLAVGGVSKSTADAELIKRWRARLPQTGAGTRAKARWESVAPGNTRTVIIDWQSADSAADFYPYEHQPSDVEGATERLPAPPGHLLLRKVVKKYEGQWPEQLVGILVGKSDSHNPTAVEVNLPLLKPTPASANDR
jgi:DsbC/DsbD-like thiol-disulfide interchange protein